MSHETLLVVALILAALLMTSAILVVSLRTTPPPASAKRTAGILAKVVCPVTSAPASVRLDSDPVTRTLGVVWCERFPAGNLNCGRGCFAAVGAAG